MKHVALRVTDVAAARAELPAGTPEVFDVGEGINVTLVEGTTDVEYDLDHVALWSSRPARDCAGVRALRLRAVRASGASRSAVRSSSSTRATRRSPSGRCSTTSPCSSTRPTT